MSTTSILIPTAATNVRKALWRIAALLLLIVAISLAAFTVGRSSVHSRHQPPVIAPSPVFSPSSFSDGCRLGRAC